jgi:hypothetical protein
MSHLDGIVGWAVSLVFRAHRTPVNNRDRYLLTVALDSFARVFDESYDALQALLSRWEFFGQEGFQRLQNVTREIESIDGATEQQRGKK